MHCSPESVVDIPVKSWDEVKEWFIKWDTLHYTLDGEKWEEIDLMNQASMDAVSWHRPASVQVVNPHTGDIVYDDEEEGENT